MLEYGFNELDNDFVTLWSKKIISGEDTLIFRDLTKLAELGQINAIQSWYLLAKKGDDNAIIDNNVSNLGNSGANELLAIACKDFFKNDRLEQMGEFYALSQIWDRTEAQDERIRDLRYTLMSSDYVRKVESSTEMYFHNYQNTLNILMLERYYEMVAGRSEVFDKVQGFGIHISKRKFKKLRKALLEMYEQDKSNVAVAYALGKNLTLFKSSMLLTSMGSRILTELSNRELSQTLQDYEVKGTKRLIKQRIDKNSQVEMQDENLSAEDRYIQDVFKNVERVKEKYNISFGGNHRKYISPGEYTIISQESKQAEEMKYRTHIATPEEIGIDKKGGTTVIKPEITEEEVEQALESARKHDTENGQLL